MTKVLQELIKNAKPYNNEVLCSLLVIPSGKLYKGFWGQNEYNQIILIGCDKENHYLISTGCQHDVLNCFNAIGLSIDIPHEYNCVRLFDICNKGFIVDNKVSSLLIKPVEEK